MAVWDYENMGESEVSVIKRVRSCEVAQKWLEPTISKHPGETPCNGADIPESETESWETGALASRPLSAFSHPHTKGRLSRVHAFPPTT